MGIRTGLNRKGFGGSCDFLSVTSWIVYNLHQILTSYKTDNLISFNVPIIEEALSQLLLIILHLFYLLLNIIPFSTQAVIHLSLLFFCSQFTIAALPATKKGPKLVCTFTECLKAQAGYVFPKRPEYLSYYLKEHVSLKEKSCIVVECPRFGIAFNSRQSQWVHNQTHLEESTTN
jgi:hypothetical protein